MAIVRYHAWWPSNTDPFYQYNIGENTARVNYYNPGYTPYMFVDGNIDAGYNYGTWGSRISSELGVAAPLDIVINGSFNQINRSGQLFIKVIATDTIVNTSLKLRIAITESNINWLAPNGTRWHHQTFRDMVPNTSGISFTISEGDTVDFTQAFSCPSPLVINNCEVVVFVQSDSGHRILQGAKSMVSSMIYELNGFSLVAPEDDDTLDICDPLHVWRSSADPDSGYPISYQVLISQTPSFSNPFLVGEFVTDTSWQCPVCLPNDATYYWKVVASNGHAPDRSSNQVFSFFVHQPPVGCPYIVGDINYSGEANGVDITYGVNYFKGYGAAPPVGCLDCPNPGETLYGAGDVNANCQFNGVDITYFVNYLKGIGPDLSYCPNCPPAQRARSH